MSLNFQIVYENLFFDKRDYLKNKPKVRYRFYYYATKCIGV